MMNCQWNSLPSQTASGVEQMAFDEALLDWCRLHAETPMVILRLYQWNHPTVSVGIHQTDKSIHASLQQLQTPYETIVRRPTGGRTLMHGQDISFAVVTNVQNLVELSIADSYCWVTKPIQAALTDCGVQVQCDIEAGPSDYINAPLCLDTKTPFDLQAEGGEKIMGAAQCRRKGGFLQHGSIQCHQLTVDLDIKTLQAAIQKQFTVHHQADWSASVPQSILEEAQFIALLNSTRIQVQDEAYKILEMLSTTSGSHLVPASDFKI